MAPIGVDLAPLMVPKWCHEPGTVCRGPQPPARGRRRGRRRRGSGAGRAAGRAAGGGDPSHPAGRAGGGGRGDHHRARAGIGPAAPARTRPRVRGDTTAGRPVRRRPGRGPRRDRKSTRLNSSHTVISYAVFCLKKKKKNNRVFTLYKNKKKTIQ